MKECGISDNDHDSSTNKGKVARLIYCFICGIAYKSSGFTAHYIECKKSFELTLLGKNRPISEHPSFLSLLNKLISCKGEDYTAELEEYNQISEDQYFSLLAKECPKCKEMFMPEVYLKHSEQCKVRSRFNTSDNEDFPNLDPMICSKNEKRQRMRRKSSMDNLKKLTKDEMKGFKIFNITLIKRMKDS